MVQGAIKDTTTYVNYVYNISSKGAAQVSSQLLGMSSLTSSVLGQLAFQTSSYLSSTEGQIMTLGTVAVAGFTKATNQAIEFDYALKNIEAIAGSSNMSSLGEQAMAMSNKYGVAVTEMTEGLETLARAGVSASNMPKILEEGMKLAKLEGLDLETAMESLISTTNLLDTTGISMDSPDYAAAVERQNQRIVSTSEVSPIGATDIINTLEHVGGYASSTNLDQEDLFAVIAQLGAKGTRGELAGTSLRAFVSAGQKDTAQRALGRIGLSVSDLWENDETMMSITDMKDVLDEAMDAKGYTKQERLEFYSDFAGYKQANQIMKINTDQARDYKEEINDAWSLGDKLQHILGSTQANLQSIFQTSVNFLTKVGQNALTLVSPLIWAAKTILDVVTNIPFMDKIFSFGLILVGARAISTIFNRIVPSIAQMTSGMGNFKKFVKDTKKELLGMKDGLVAVKTAIMTGDTSYFDEQARKNEFNRSSDEDILKHRGIEELGKSDLISVYLADKPVTSEEREKIAVNKEKEYKALLKEIKKLQSETPEQRNQRQKSQQEPSKVSEKTKALQDINGTLKGLDETMKGVTTILSEFSNALRGFSGIRSLDNALQSLNNFLIDLRRGVGKDGDITFFDGLFNKIKNHTFKVEIVNATRIIPVHDVGSVSWGQQRQADREVRDFRNRGTVVVEDDLRSKGTKIKGIGSYKNKSVKLNAKYFDDTKYHEFGHALFSDSRNKRRSDNIKISESDNAILSKTNLVAPKHYKTLGNIVNEYEADLFATELARKKGETVSKARLERMKIAKEVLDNHKVFDDVRQDYIEAMVNAVMLEDEAIQQQLNDGLMEYERKKAQVAKNIENRAKSTKNKPKIRKKPENVKHVAFDRAYQNGDITTTEKIGTPALNISNFGDLVDLDSTEGIVTKEKVQQALNMVIANESKRIFKFSGKTKEQLIKELHRNLDSLFGVGGTDMSADGVTPADNLLDMIGMMAGAGELVFSTDNDYDTSRWESKYYDTRTGTTRVRNKKAKEDMSSIFGAKEQVDATRQIRSLLKELSPYTREGKKINASDSQIAVLYESLGRLFGPDFAEVYEQTKVVGSNFEQLHATMTDPGVLAAIDNLTDKDDILFFRAIKKRMERGEGAFSEQIYSKFKSKMRKIKGHEKWDYGKVTNADRFSQLQAMMDIADQRGLIAEGSVKDVLKANIEAAAKTVKQPHLGTHIAAGQGQSTRFGRWGEVSPISAVTNKDIISSIDQDIAILQDPNTTPDVKIKTLERLGYGEFKGEKGFVANRAMGITPELVIQDLKKLKEEVLSDKYSDVTEFSKKVDMDIFDDHTPVFEKDREKITKDNNDKLRRAQYSTYLSLAGNVYEDVPLSEQLVPHAGGQVKTHPKHQNRYVYATSALMANPFMDDDGQRYREEFLSKYTPEEIAQMEQEWKQEVFETARENLNNNTEIKRMAILDDSIALNANFAEYQGDSFFVDLYKDMQYKAELLGLKYVENGEAWLEGIASVFNKDIEQVQEDFKTVNTNFLQGTKFNGIDLEVAAESVGVDLSKAPAVYGDGTANQEDKANYFLEQLGLMNGDSVVNAIIGDKVVGNIGQAISGGAVKDFNEHPVVKIAQSIFSSRGGKLDDRQDLLEFANSFGFGLGKNKDGKWQMMYAKDFAKGMIDSFDKDKALADQPIFQAFMRKFGMEQTSNYMDHIETNFPETRVYKAELYDHFIRAMGNEGYAQQVPQGIAQGLYAERMYAQLQAIAHILLELEAHEQVDLLNELPEEELKALNEALGFEIDKKPTLGNIDSYSQSIHTPLGLKYQRQSSTYQDRSKREPEDVKGTIMRGLNQLKANKYAFSDTDSGPTPLKRKQHIGVEPEPGSLEDDEAYQTLAGLTPDEMMSLTLETGRKARTDRKVAEVRSVASTAGGIKGVKSERTKRRIFKGDRKNRDQAIVFDKDKNYIGILKNEQDNYNDVTNDVWQIARNIARDQGNMDQVKAALAIQTGLSEKNIKDMQATEAQKKLAHKKYMAQDYVNVNALTDEEYQEAINQMEDVKLVKKIKKENGVYKYDVNQKFRKTVDKETFDDMVKNNLIRTDKDGNYLDVTEKIGDDGSSLYEVWNFKELVSSYDDILENIKVKGLIDTMRADQTFAQSGQTHMDNLLAPLYNQIEANKKEIKAIEGGKYSKEAMRKKMDEELSLLADREGPYTHIETIEEEDIATDKIAKKYKPFTEEEIKEKINILNKSNEDLKSIAETIERQGINYEELLLNNPMIALMEVMNPDFLNANEGLSAQDIITRSILEPGNAGLKMFPGNLINPDDVLANINVEKLQALAEINPDILKNIIAEFYGNYTNEFLDTLVEHKGMETIVTDLLSDSFNIDKVDNRMKKLFNITGDDIDKSTYTKDVLRVMRERWGDTISSYNDGKGIDLRSMDISGERLANAFKGIRAEEGSEWLQNDMVSFFMSAFGINPDTAMSMFDVDLFNFQDSSRILNAQKIKMAQSTNKKAGQSRRTKKVNAAMGTTDESGVPILKSGETVTLGGPGGSTVTGGVYTESEETLRLKELENKLKANEERREKVDEEIRILTDNLVTANKSEAEQIRVELSALEFEFDQIESNRETLESEIEQIENTDYFSEVRKGVGHQGDAAKSITNDIGDVNQDMRSGIYDKEQKTSFGGSARSGTQVSDVPNKSTSDQYDRAANTARLPDYERDRLEHMYDPNERDQLSKSALPTSISALILGVQAVINAAEQNIAERREIRKNQEEAINNAQQALNQAQNDLTQERSEYEVDRKAKITAEMISAATFPPHNSLRKKLYERYKKGQLTHAELEAISGVTTQKTDGTSDTFTYMGRDVSVKEQMQSLKEATDLESLPEEYAQYSPLINALVDVYSANPMLELFGRYMDNPEVRKGMKARMLMYANKAYAEGKMSKKLGDRNSFVDIANSLDDPELYAAYYDMVDIISNANNRHIGNVDLSMIDDEDVNANRDYFDSGSSWFSKKRSSLRTRRFAMTPKERGKSAATYIKDSIKDGIDYLSVSSEELQKREEWKIRNKYSKMHKQDLLRIDALSDDDALKEAGDLSDYSYDIKNTAEEEYKKMLAKTGGSNPMAIMEEATRRGQVKAARNKLQKESARRIIATDQSNELKMLRANMEEDPDYLSKQNGYRPNKLMRMTKRGLDRTADFFGSRMTDKDGYDEYIHSVDGFSKKLDGAGKYLTGFQEVVKEVAQVFPPLQVAVVGLTFVIEILKKAEMASVGLGKFMRMGRTLSQGGSVNILKGLGPGGKGFKITPTSRLGKIMGGTSTMLGSIGSKIAAAAGPIAIVAAIIIALGIALKASFESHKKYVETLKKEQKELQSRARSLEQQTYIMKRQADHMGDTPAKLRLTKQLELAEKKLMMVQTQRRANTINLAMANEDALNGETGLWYKITNLWGGAQSHVEEREGLYGRVQEAHEWAEGDLFGLYTTDAIQAVSDLKTASPFEYQAMENYGPELKSLYDYQSRAIKRTGSYEGAENDPAYQRRKKRIMNQTGLSEGEVDTLLENMQTEYQVTQAKDAMEAQRVTVRSEHELKRAAARMGVNTEELKAMKGTKEYQQLMIQAQADMIQQEERGAAFMAVIKDMGMNVLIEIGAIVKSIWDLAVIVSSLTSSEWWILLIKAAVWGTDGWKQEDLDKLEAPSKAAEDIQANGSRMVGAVRASWEDIDYALDVQDQQYNDDLVAAANEVYDPMARGNFGNGPKNMYHLGGSGGRDMPGMSSQSNSGQSSGASVNQNQISTNYNNQGISSNSTVNTQQNSNSASLTTSQKHVASAGTTKTLVSNNQRLSPKSSTVNDATTPNVGQVVESKNTDNSRTDNSNTVTIQNININTADDPEAIKAMFLELIIELQEQINPRQVSRTVGEVSTETSTDTNTTPTSSTDPSSSSSSQSNSNSGSSSPVTPQPSAAAIKRHRSTQSNNSASVKQVESKWKNKNIANKYDMVRKVLYNGGK